MRHTLKEELKKAFEAPAPRRKAVFLQTVKPAGLHFFDFVLIQAGYIRIWIWGISFLVFAISLFCSLALSLDMLWAISASMPLLALMMIAETGRSAHYKMAELETASRFSLKSVILARLCVLGLGNLVLLCLLLPIALRNSYVSPLQAGFYIITPFLLTAFLCLHILRRRREPEALYLCIGTSAGISSFIFPLRQMLPALYEECSLISWILAAAFLGIGVIKQYQNLINEEAPVWN